MTAISDLSDLVNRMTGGNSGTPENLWFHKVARIGGAAPVAIPIAGRPYSLWTYDGFPGAGSAPTTWANPDNTTAGGLLQADPGGGRQKWLVQFAATGLVAGTLILYDRLGANGNLSGTTTGAQSFTGTLTRYTGGTGNIMWYEIYGNTTTILGSTGTTVTVSYTNQSATSGRTSTAVAIGGTWFREGNQIRMVPLQSGDTGVQSVQSATLAGSTGTAGAWGITIARPLATSAISTAGVGAWRDFTTGLPGLPEIATDACLGLLWLPSLTTSPEVMGCVSTVEA
ncbi:MAG: hypothetical protein OEV62_00245 [Actinomycetota bacterium]|nr:hypothetical protein [Actinomycetota bacterium]